MVREYYSQQSAVVLNVSQQDRSSRSPTPDSQMDDQAASYSTNASNVLEGSLQVQQTIELVEDSFKEYQVGAGLAGDELPLEIEHDEMGDEDSAEPNPHERGIETAKPPDRHWSETNPPAQSLLPGAQKGSQASRVVASSKSAGKRCQHSEAEIRAEALDTSNAASGLHREPTKSKEVSKPERKGAPSPAKQKGRLPRVAKQTALKALHIMQDKHSDQAQAIEESMEQMSYRPQESRPKIQNGVEVPPKKTASQLQTPLTAGVSRQSQGQRTSKGKLPTHKPPVAASASGSLAPKPKATSKKRVAPEKSDDEYEDTQYPRTRRTPASKLPTKGARRTQGPKMNAALGQSDGTSKPTAPKPAGALKRPKAAADSAKPPTESKSIYDVSDESDAQRPAKKHRGTSQVPKPLVVKPRAGGQTRQRMQVHQDEQSSSTTAIKEAKRPVESLESPCADSRPNGSATAVVKRKEPGMVLKKTSRPSDQSSDRSRLHRDPTFPLEGDRTNGLPLQKTDPAPSLSKPRPSTQTAAPILSDTAIAEGTSHRHRHSQANAIDVAENVETSSPMAPEPVWSHQQRINRKDQDREKVKQRLTTPPNLRSSPPEVGPRSGLVPDTTKQSVIGWDKTGPLNQGSSRRLRPVPGSARWDRSLALPEQTAKSGSRHKTQSKMVEASEQGGAGSKHTGSATSLGNVASKGEDAFAAFRGQATSQAGHGSAGAAVRAAQMISGKTPAVESGEKDARLGSTMSFRHSPARTQALLVVSRGHQHHELLPAGDEDEYQRPLDDFEGSTLVDEEVQLDKAFIVPTVSQTEMPPPPGKGKNIAKSQPVPAAPSMTAPARPEIVAKAAPDLQSAGHKRRHEAVPERTQNDVKRVRMEQRFVTVGRADDQVHATLEKSAVQPSPSPQKLKSLITRPSKAVRMSSQTVDVTGSPIQKGVDVPALTTALEHYAQDTLSPSRSEAAYTEAPSSQRSRKPTTNFLRIAQPLAQNVRVSGIGRMPTAVAQVGSPTPSVRATGAVVDALIRQDQMREPPTDPFTSSRDSHTAMNAEQNQSTSMQAISRRDMGVSMPSADAAAIDEGEDQQSEVDQDVYEEGESDDGKENQDPDKTLVDPETSHHRPSKRLSSKSSGERSPSSKLVDPVEEEDNELGIWRKALKPYQMTLFDSLVIVSHKLVRGLVDQETAVSDMIKDYRTRGESIVIHLENAKAKAYHEHLRRVQQRNLDIADKLVKGNQKLQKISTQDKTELRRGPRLADSLHTIGDRLEGMMEVLG